MCLRDIVGEENRGPGSYSNANEKSDRGVERYHRIKRRTPQPAVPNQEDNSENNREEIPQLGSPSRPISPVLQSTEDMNPPRQAGAWGTEALQPVGILSKAAQTGRFSLETILCVPEDDESNSRNPLAQVSVSADSHDDPIAYGLLSFPVAFGLFERCVSKYSFCF